MFNSTVIELAEGLVMTYDVDKIDEYIDLLDLNLIDIKEGFTMYYSNRLGRYGIVIVDSYDSDGRYQEMYVVNKELDINDLKEVNQLEGNERLATMIKHARNSLDNANKPNYINLN